MEHVLFILNSHDIEPARSRAREYPGCRVAVFDPSLLDQVRAEGLDPTCMTAAAKWRWPPNANCSPPSRSSCPA
jgi:hypothetical protein